MLKRIKNINLTDIVGIIKFLIVLIPSIIYKVYLKINKKELWLVCEIKFMARDNGYIFYKYLKNSHPEILSYFAISKNCSDYSKVKELGNIIEWGTLKHYFLYMSSTKNISSHKEGNPNHLLFTILHVYLNLYNNRVFLQHGVLYEDFEMFHWKNTKFKIFICGAKKEYEFIKEKYGYPDKSLKFTGLARFDNLLDYKTNDKYILFIPTWRRWIDSKEKFIASEYYEKINSFINNSELEKILEENDKYLLFYPHVAFQKYLDNFSCNNERVKVCNINNSNIQDLIREGAMLITDYSSIFTDVAFMKKPIIYYQFDRNEFYTKHFTHFPFLDCEKEWFGKIVDNEAGILEKLEYYINNNYKIEDSYIKNIDDFFGVIDNKNCERIFNCIVEEKK